MSGYSIDSFKWFSLNGFSSVDHIVFFKNQKQNTLKYEANKRQIIIIARGGLKDRHESKKTKNNRKRHDTRCPVSQPHTHTHTTLSQSNGLDLRCFQKSLLLLLLLHLCHESSLDLGRHGDGHGVLLELSKGVGVGVDRKDHALLAVAIGRAVSLLAVEESGLVAVEDEVKGLGFGDVGLVGVLEVGVDGGAGQFLAWVRERRLGQGVVDGAEVEVDFLAGGDLGQIRRVESEHGAVLEPHSHGGDSCGCTGRVRGGAGLIWRRGG